MEWLAAEYSIPFTAAVWKIPLTLAMVMLPIRNERMGSSGGPGYVVRASLAAKNKARAFLEKHFLIVAKPPAETGWHLGENTFLKIP